MKKTLTQQQSGSVLISMLIVTVFLSTIVYSLVVLANANLSRARSRILLLQAQYAAESGVDAAVAILNGGNESYAGQTTELQILNSTQYRATFTTSVTAGSKPSERVITAIGKVYAPKTATTARFSRTIESVVQRDSGSVVNSGIISRNLIEVDSGVKNIRAQSLYLNGYIHMNKNTTNLIAENITVLGRRTTSTSCSIGGSGNLLKPATFTDPLQTKTNITVGYNNCITPPGNTSNANFNVIANQSNLPKVQSTYIPWNQYLDNTYTSSPTGCAEWIAGTSTASITIPNTGNAKKTHYPDSGSGVSTSCGTSGNLNLGSRTYTITDHVHIRGNLCATSACTPTFYNPNTGAANAKYIFVEGTINFDGVQSLAGSGPVILVSYGSDPASKASACPYGGAIYLGNSGTVSAPGIYFLAVNGLCIDKTKFAGSPNLGGLSGKNIYIASSPATPFDLTLDSSFPTSSVPIDLSWKAIRYRRL